MLPGNPDFEEYSLAMRKPVGDDHAIGIFQLKAGASVLQKDLVAWHQNVQLLYNWLLTSCWNISSM